MKKITPILVLAIVLTGGIFWFVQQRAAKQNATVVQTEDTPKQTAPNYREIQKKPKHSAPYELLAEDSHFIVRMFGQKVGWIEVRIPIDDAYIVPYDRYARIGWSAFWSDATIEPKEYADVFASVFRASRQSENRIDFFADGFDKPTHKKIQKEFADKRVNGFYTMLGSQIHKEFDFLLRTDRDKIELKSKLHHTIDTTEFMGAKIAAAIGRKTNSKMSPLMETRMALTMRHVADKPTSNKKK